MGTLFSIQKGQHVRIHGFLQSRGFKENLADFMEKARKNIEVKLADDLKPEKAAIDRNTIEVVAARVISLDSGSRKKARD